LFRAPALRLSNSRTRLKRRPAQPSSGQAVTNDPELSECRQQRRLSSVIQFTDRWSAYCLWAETKKVKQNRDLESETKRCRDPETSHIKRFAITH
jgi:hypothetical protein